MKPGDKYLHMKGQTYVFREIGVPLSTIDVNDEMISKHVKKIGEIRYHENTHDISIYDFNGVMLVDHPVALVIYYKNTDDEVTLNWGREPNDFFGYKHYEDGSLKKRFILLNDDVKN